MEKTKKLLTSLLRVIIESLSWKIIMIKKNISSLLGIKRKGLKQFMQCWAIGLFGHV